MKKKNYHLKRKKRILKGLIGNYQGQNKVLKRFILIVFILEQLVIELYFLSLFNKNDIYIIIF